MYKPHIALLSGIAWDHINVFPTFENYINQFRIFVDLIEDDGKLIYYAEDQHINEIVTNTTNNIKTKPYKEHLYEITPEITALMVKHENIPIQIFGKHNMQNI